MFAGIKDASGKKCDLQASVVKNHIIIIIYNHYYYYVQNNPI